MNVIGKFSSSHLMENELLLINSFVESLFSIMDHQDNRERNTILSLLAPYFGATAPWVLAQAERRARTPGEIPWLLANALSNQQRREELLALFVALEEQRQVPDKKHEAPLESGAAEVLPPLTLSIAEHRLMDLIGEAGRDTAQKMYPKPNNVVDLYARLALHIENAEDRKKFLTLCPGRIPDV